MSRTQATFPADTVLTAPPAPQGLLQQREEFVGREHELRVLDAVLAQVRATGARVALIRGAPGVGKSALVREFLRRHPDLLVLRGSGEESEAALSYALVDQVFGPVGLRGVALLAHAERVLPVEEPVVVGRQILGVLMRSGAARPSSIVIDDAHWVDVCSLRALLFALRRLATYPVLTILVVPSDDARLPGGLERLAEGHTGDTLDVGPLAPVDVQALASAVSGTRVSGLAAHRLCAHTLGNARHVLALLAETPVDHWSGWTSALPAPRAYSRAIGRRLAACTGRARRLVEAAAVLGDGAPLATVAVLGEVEEPLAELEEACDAGLLDASADAPAGVLAFAHPLVRAAVYGQLTAARRLQLHRTAARLVDDERASIHHLAAATRSPDDPLATRLQRLADRARGAGQWSEAAWALLESGRLTTDRERREQRLLWAAGLLGDAGATDRDPGTATDGPLRDVTTGYLALVAGRAAEAHDSLHAAWEHRDEAGPEVAVLAAQRLALHGVGRLRGAEVVEWARWAVKLAGPDDPVRVEAEALLGLGEGWSGQARAVGDTPGARAGAALALDPDDAGVREEAACVLHRAARSGSVWCAVWSYVWLARAGFVVGAWDEAAVDAERAVSLLEESGHGWLRPLARCVAVLVPAARGEWVAAGEHVGAGVARSGDYELMVVASGVAGALVPAARGDHEGVLRALAPVVGLAE